jgi:hypothetical protein
MSVPWRVVESSAAERPVLSARVKRLVWLALLALIGAGAGLRWRLLDVPLDRDEGEFAYIAQQMLRGVPPYESAYAMKLPGIYAAYALVMTVAGQSLRGIHLGLLALGAATTGAVFLLGRRLYDSAVGLAAAGAFVLLSTMPQVHGSSAQAEQFVLLPTVLAWWLAVRAVDHESLSNERPASLPYVTLLTIGVLCGLAITIKQHALFLALATAVYVGVAQWHPAAAHGRRATRFPMALAAMAVGVSIPLAAMVAAIVAAGAWEKFWFWAVVVAGNYATDMPWPEGLARLRSNSLLLTKGAPLVYGLAACGLSACIWDDIARRRRWFLIVTLLAAFVAICPGLHFRRHYFILLLPSASLLFALGATSIARLVGKHQSTSAPPAIALTIVAATLLVSLWSNRAHYFERSPAEIARATFGGNPFPEALAIAEHIGTRTTSDETILVMGSEPELPFYARRRSATRYIYMYPLVERQPYARRMQEEMIVEVEAARPAYIVFAAVAASWTMNDDSERHLLKWFDAYSREHYELVGCIDVRDEETVYIWGPSARVFRPVSNAWLRVYRRRE